MWEGRVRVGIEVRVGTGIDIEERISEWCVFWCQGRLLLAEEKSERENELRGDIVVPEETSQSVWCKQEERNG